MNRYQELTSTKYWLESVRQQNRKVQQQKNRSNRKVLAIGAASISFLLVSFYTMPVWVSAIVRILDANY